jgi:hypothetical protein
MVDEHDFADLVIDQGSQLLIVSPIENEEPGKLTDELIQKLI